MRWWQVRRRDLDLERELRSDLDLEEEEQRENGVPQDEARYAARRALGNTGLIKEKVHEAWGIAAIEHLLQDLRYALRQLRRFPGFTLVMVLILGLGIGANCAIFSFVDAFFLKPLPVPDPERLLRIYARGPGGHYGAGFSYPEYEQLRNHASSFSELAIESERPQLHVVMGSASIETRGEFVSANYFHLLGVNPPLGRAFSAEEDAVPDRNAVAVISDRLWNAHFNRASAVLGQVVSINSIPFRVIGVAPHDFYGDLPGQPVDIWIPAAMFGAAGYGCADGTFNCSLFDSMIGALAPGVAPAQAMAEDQSVVVWSATDWPERPSRRQIALFSASRESPDEQADDAAQLRLLMLVTASLLVIACANLAGLLLARGLTRRKEIAVRLSIGAARSRIVRQLLTESLLLAGMGGMAGLALSLAGKWILSGFYSTDSEGFQHLYDLSLDWRVVAFSTGLTLLAAVLFGLIAALRALRQDLIADLKDAGSTEQPGKGRLRSALVVGQIALSIALVIASGLLIRSASEIRKGTNFDPAKALVLRLRPELMKYTPQQVEALVRSAQQHLGALPDVESVAFMQGGEGLVWDWRSGRDAEVSLSQQPRGQGTGLPVRKQDVSTGFFHTLRIPLLQGREFSDRDRMGSPLVAVVNESLAQRLWPAGGAVGQTAYVNAIPFQIVGVCADLQPRSSVHAPEPHLYLSYWQSNAVREGDIRLVIRTRSDPEMLLPQVHSTITSVDPKVPVGEDMSLSEQVGLEYVTVLLAQKVMTFCGVLAIGLSTLGLYSVLSFAVRTRSREIGIRMALGARRLDVLGLFLLQGAKLAIAGVVAGVTFALVATRLLAGLLYDVKANDPAILIGGALLLFLVAIVACFLPASRAASINPVRVLRTE